MNPSPTIQTMQDVLRLFGSISNNLVYIAEELPSLNLTKDLERRIVAFSCDFLEFLAAYDARLKQFLVSFESAPARGEAPPGGAQVLEDFRQQLWEQIETMHRLITDVRTQGTGVAWGPALEILLNESGANILKAFLAIRELLDPLIRQMGGSRKPS